MRAVALALTLSLSLAACFPESARHRTYAKVTEGGLLAAGIALLAVTNTGADCDNMGGLGNLPPDRDCKSRSSLVGGIGLTLIITGLIGFVATVTTTPDDPPTPPAAPPATSATPPSTVPTPIAPAAAR
ncbi:MAG: hypothetical protein H6Q90_6749 [Deltaproteobacteria bacterium]|nr:hypothetical protein [Deltaproteobacteria bacterium]